MLFKNRKFTFISILVSVFNSKADKFSYFYKVRHLISLGHSKPEENSGNCINLIRFFIRAGLSIMLIWNVSLLMSCKTTSDLKNRDVPPSLPAGVHPAEDGENSNESLVQKSQKKGTSLLSNEGSLSEAEEEGPAKEKIGTLIFQGKPLTFLYYKPLRLKHQNVPLIILFHGENQKGSDVAQLSQLSSFAKKTGFAIVYPTAIKSWKNMGSEFLKSLIAQMSVLIQIDPQRVYMVGGGEGGAYALQMACEMSDGIAATISMMSSLTKKAYMSCKPNRPMPLLLVHGTLDENIPWTPNKKSRYISVTENLKFWQENNKCSSAFWLNKKEDQEQMIPSEKNYVETHQYFNCKDSALKVVKMVGWDSHWPGSSKYVDSNKRNKRIPASMIKKYDVHLQKLIWDFLSQWTL